MPILEKLRLQVKVKTNQPDGSNLLAEDQVALPNLDLNSLFSRMDGSLNQKVITTSVGSNHLYKT